MLQIQQKHHENKDFNSANGGSGIPLGMQRQKYKFGYEAVNNSSDSDTTKTASITNLQPKLVKTAGMHFKVKSVQQTTGQITSLTSNCNGMVVHHQMGSSAMRSLDVRISDDSVMRVTSFNTTSDMTIKIPASKYKNTCFKIRGVHEPGCFFGDLC